jgi:hypothetical protein
MINEQTILTSERLRDDLTNLKLLLRTRYRSGSDQVRADDLRHQAAGLAEKWLVEVATDPAVTEAIGASNLADLNIHFQRVLTFAERATIRTRYDLELGQILKDYSVRVVLPLKQSRGRVLAVPQEISDAPSRANSAFVGQSFAEDDVHVNQCVADVLTVLGLNVVTGDKPKADRISEKVKDLIEQQDLFVGVFTRRDKIARKREWTTSAWVIDEKAYALGRRKPLILLKEQGVESIGGIQGDYEYFEFSRDALEKMAVKLMRLFKLTNHGLS